MGGGGNYVQISNHCPCNAGGRNRAYHLQRFLQVETLKAADNRRLLKITYIKFLGSRRFKIDCLFCFQIYIEIIALKVQFVNCLYNAEIFCYTACKADDCRLSPAKGVTCMRKIDWLNLAISTAGLIASVISIFS